MNPTNHPAIWQAHDRAVVAVLNAIDCTEDEAKELVNSMTELIFITIQTYLKEINAANHH